MYVSQALELLAYPYDIFLGNLPPTPSWVSERPYLSRDYVTGTGVSHSTSVSMHLIIIYYHDCTSYLFQTDTAFVYDVV